MEVGNTLFKYNSPPIANRDKACYLAAIDSADIMFNGKMYSVDF